MNLAADPAVEARRASGQAATGLPVVSAWAGVGVVVLLVGLSAITRWLMFGDVRPTRQGPVESPGWMTSIGHTWEILGLVGLTVFIHRVVAKPWRAAGSITTDGMFTLACLTLIWMDPLINYSHVWQTFNASLVNVGSWGTFIPGWRSSGAEHIATPILWLWPTYAYMMYGGVLLLCSGLRHLQGRWPAIPLWRLGVLTIPALAVGEVIGEQVMLRIGLYSYPAVVGPLSLFGGHYYQQPLYMAVLLAVLMVVWALFRLHVDGDGLTVVEQGVHRIGGGRRRSSIVRTLAVIGAMNISYLAIIEGPMQLFSAHAGSYPRDVVERTYLLNESCGPGTEVACP